jgi:hypothetical protein
MANQESPTADSLVAIVVAARRAGDRQLERRARRALLERHGMKVSFASDHARIEKGGDDAK